MVITFLAFAALIAVSIGLGVHYVLRMRSSKELGVHLSRLPLINPVPLDRSPKMPHRPDATS